MRHCCVGGRVIVVVVVVVGVVGVVGVFIVVVVIVVVDEDSCFGVDNIDGDDVPPSKLMIGEGETTTDIFCSSRGAQRQCRLVVLSFFTLPADADCQSLQLQKQ